MFLYKALDAFTENTAHSTDTHPVQVDTAVVVFSGWLFCPPRRSRRRSVFTNSLHAGLAAAAALPVESSGSSKADFIFVKCQVCKCTSQSWCLSPLFIPLIFFFLPRPRLIFCSFFSSRVWLACDVVSSSPPSPDVFLRLVFFFVFFLCCFRLSTLFFCCCFGTIVPSVAWGEDGIDELHVVGRVYRELLVCTANFTYIYATSLSTLYSLCLLYTQIQHIKYLYKGVL